MPLLTNPNPEILENHARGCVVGHWLHFGEVMQEIWDCSKRLRTTVILSADDYRDTSCVGFSIFKGEGSPIKTWRFTPREIKALVDAIPNDQDRMEVAAHMKTAAGRATLAAHLGYTNPRPEVRP